MAETKPHYEGYGKKAKLHQLYRWYRVYDLLENLSTFCCHELDTSRHKIVNRLSFFGRSGLYSQHSRFPENGLYVPECAGSLARDFQQLRLALALKGGPENQLLTVNKSLDFREKVLEQEFDMNRFYDTVSRIITNLGDEDLVMDRESFEREYGLTWVE